MGMEATVKQYSIIVRTRGKKVRGRTKLEQEQIWNGFQGFPRCHGGYLRGRCDSSLNLPPTGPLNLADTKFQDLKALDTPPSPCARALRPQWKSEESLRLIDAHAALLRQLDHNRNVDRTMTRDV